MAMPTRLDVLLHSRKSAAAGLTEEIVRGKAANRLASSVPPNFFANFFDSIARLIMTQNRFQLAALSKPMARKSGTLVNVGPGVDWSPMPLKNPVEALSATKPAGTRPRGFGRATAVSS